MKGTYVALIALGTGVVGLAVGVLGAGFIGKGAVVGGAIGGAMAGICATTDAAVDSGLINEEQVEQLATSIGEKFAQNHPDLTKNIAEAPPPGSVPPINISQSPSPNCDRVIQGIFQQIRQD
ncbi:hypothetical protein [Crocosphaera chwakensis]|uniref:DNA gyrase subunit B n=1 Tax=Crocosphaera chwakensis CCY0110 TaxID=391612 RepID=A3IWP3_9CHRO|nr:hypothetical protein [Crocosphaera chwakensis]EAZ89098.1 DNA gyrase subunit B [Crocosphaera chwakensis CCY0110]